MPQYSREGYEKAGALLKLLAQLAEEKHASMGQISLAWMLCKKPFIIPIPGSRRLARLDTMKFAVFGGHSAR